jgi:hypothetical protein
MPDLVPHPLVTSVGLQLAGQGVVTLPRTVKRPAELLAAIEQGQVTGGDTTDSASPDDPIADDNQSADQKNVLATALADQANLPGLSLFAGFLGGPVEREKQLWRLLYFDARLSSWLLVPEAAIVVHERLKDRNAPFGLRDVLWVDGTATVVHGEGARSNEGRFLVGDFTRAGDFSASTTGGTFSAATGLLCEATTPGCCAGKRTR